MKDKFQAICINNKFEDFGSHTGFKWQEATFDHLVVGQYYNFENGFSHHFFGSGHHTVKLLDHEHSALLLGNIFIFEDHTPRYSFYNFFSIQEARDMKIEQILKIQ